MILEEVLRRENMLKAIIDRLIQQALLQILQPHFDATFSDGSYGFRPGRSAHQAVERARKHIAAGHRWVVDMDLEKFLKERLRLKVNREKSAVARPWKRKFLGYSVTVNHKPKLKVAPESVKRMKDKLRELFREGRGRSIGKTIETLKPKLRGWLTYFRKAEVKEPFENLDQWLRRKLRCIMWRQWKRPKTRRVRLQQLGLEPERARSSAANGRGPWWNAGASHMNQAVPNSWFERCGLVNLLQEHQRLARLI